MVPSFISASCRFKGAKIRMILITRELYVIFNYNHKSLKNNSMKNSFILPKFLAITMVLLLAGIFQPSLYCQSGDSVNVDVKYTQYRVAPTFETTFSYPEDKKNFKKLRAYFFEQSDLIDRLSGILRNYEGELYYGYQDTAKCRQALSETENWISKLKKDAKYVVPRESYYRYKRISTFYEVDWDETFPSESTVIQMEDLEKLRGDLNTVMKSRLDKYKKYGQLVSNLSTLKSDLKSCERTIDEALRPETEDQRFRTNMSILFAVLIAILLSVFFFLIFKRGDQNIAKSLLSELGLQFITLFVLIIAIILFGILDILKGSELAAILAGISGYILGSKTNAASNQGSQNPQSNLPPNPLE